MQKFTESRIDDVFEGFDKDKIYSLENGQKWQQTKYQYKYVYNYRPKVTIWEDGDKYLLEIEGVGEMVEVRRLY
ncbi:hypothetical protein MYX76_04685 [Desulfobacterota bacterium AH_259_B03_O07]|nr:hypothetical protein [Desulfobacterota bacterium AH_259_B03_O07]